MKRILGFFALILPLVMFTSCGRKMDTLTAPKPDEAAAVAGRDAAVRQPAAGDRAGAASSATTTTPPPISTTSGPDRYETDSEPPIVVAVDGNPHSVSYTGSYQDLLIPVDPTIVAVTFTVDGADGGFARVHDTFFGNEVVAFANGGSGASASATFAVGSGSGQIPHGSVMRFVVGGRGTNGNSGGVVGAGFDYGGGGGGTAVLIRVPLASSFSARLVAGGGSGAYQGMIAYNSVDHEPGQGGRSGTGGGSGNGDIGAAPGGAGGGGGSGNATLGGGGGGAFGAGGGVLCVGIPDFNTNEAGEGGPGFEVGGYGGSSGGCINFVWRNGGYGYGGGGAGSGAGGGGGGFSGGGVGGTTGRGGGGGSFASFNATQQNISAGGSTPSPANGAATYQFTLNAPPLVACKGTTVHLDANGQGSIAPSDVRDSASDPEGGTLQFSLSKSSFGCSDVGANNVTLTVTDDVGQTASCVAVVTVLDDTDPTVATKNISVELDASGMATITPAMVDNGSSDNCAIQSRTLDRTTFNCSHVGHNTVQLTVTDVNGNSASSTADVLVKDTSGPAIASVTADPSVLWPPDHKMKPVAVAIASSDNCPGTTCRIILVSGNEPLNGPGDGNSAPDWEITGDGTVSLRAERSGTGPGRVYTITVECTDASGNKTRSTTSVAVPHDLRTLGAD